MIMTFETKPVTPTKVEAMLVKEDLDVIKNVYEWVSAKGFSLRVYFPYSEDDIDFDLEIDIHNIITKRTSNARVGQVVTIDENNTILVYEYETFIEKFTDGALIEIYV